MKNVRQNDRLFRLIQFVVFDGLLVLLALSLFLTSCTQEELSPQEDIPLTSHAVKAELEPWEKEVVRLTKKMRRFHNFKVALAQGYDVDLSGYVPQMGHHYGKQELIDDLFELEKPEVLLYVPEGEEGMKFVAVEYLVTVPDPENPPAAPEGFTGSEDEWFFNTDIGMWTLHVWVAMENSDGIFAARNQALP
ncbi:hypothetical protein [Zeaxanthinibacter enoshimensis]|uniref:Uncharacterized protein n=1 Tax=Zeaxanthinibacter enoshimensis TaxID=392009 RepID=A0A4R6TTK3_9FLAO|nr:hypothetical protein [Zeaxanthinibacter enoshimensis]TDQ32278.1 hypothetical protein CLV82_0101 [Zeaxanthinibacter enoshimensis]